MATFGGAADPTDRNQSRVDPEDSVCPPVVPPSDGSLWRSPRATPSGATTVSTDGGGDFGLAQPSLAQHRPGMLAQRGGKTTHAHMSTREPERRVQRAESAPGILHLGESATMHELRVR